MGLQKIYKILNFLAGEIGFNSLPRFLKIKQK